MPAPTDVPEPDDPRVWIPLIYVGMGESFVMVIVFEDRLVLIPVPPDNVTVEPVVVPPLSAVKPVTPPEPAGAHRKKPFESMAVSTSPAVIVPSSDFLIGTLPSDFSGNPDIFLHLHVVNV